VVDIIYYLRSREWGKLKKNTIVQGNLGYLYDSLLIAGGALLVRIIHLLYICRIPLFSYQVVDASWHFQWAEMIAGGDLLAYSPFFRAPLYPWLLGVFHAVFGNSPFTGAVLSVLLSTFGVFLFHRIALCYLSRKTALITGIVWALWGTSVFYSLPLLIVPLFTTLLLGAFLSLLRKKTTCGWLLIGLACITRPTAILLLPVIWIFSAKPGWRQAMAFLLPILLVWGCNIYSGDTGTVISNQGGINFYIGNGEDADGFTAFAPVQTAGIIFGDTLYRDNVQIAGEIEYPGSVGSVISSRYTSRALQEIIDSPGRWIALMGKKLLCFISPTEIPSNYDVYYFRQFSPVLNILLVPPPFAFPGMFIWALLPGALLAGKSNRKEWRVFLWWVLPGMVTVLFFVTARLRLSALPFLLLWLTVRTVKYGRKSLYFAPIGVALGVLVAVLTSGTVTRGGVNMPFQDGCANYDAGNFGEAQVLFYSALERASVRGDIDLNRIDAMYNIGLIESHFGNYDKAMSWWQTVLVECPEHSRAAESVEAVERHLDYEESLQ